MSAAASFDGVELAIAQELRCGGQVGRRRDGTDGPAVLDDVRTNATTTDRARRDSGSLQDFTRHRVTLRSRMSPRPFVLADV